MTQAWLFSRTTDTLAFAGTALISFALAWWLPSVGVAGETPPWAWLVFVVFIDVAHVWSTLFRTYFDGEEVKRRPLLYAGAPLLAWALGVAAHAVSAEFFWRVLAYVAVWHFVRQQVGWMVLYGRRARDSEAVVRFDRLAIYAATLGPVVWWHAHLPLPFWWFKENDFVSGLPAVLGTVALALHFSILGAWVVFSLRRLHAGKMALLFATWLAWFGGIVLAKSDLGFTVMNVALHGVPYLVLTRRYAVNREAEAGFGRGVRAVLGLGTLGFLALLWALAFGEEFLWDRLVWHDHANFFGDSGVDLEGVALTLLVPLLSLPQTTHYLLDGFVWKPSGDPLLVKRLGWSADTTTLRHPS